MSWRDDAACKGMTQTIFFPPNRVWDEKHCATARRICAACPVKEPCLAEALKVTTNDDGIFAGTTPHQRNRMRTGIRVVAKFPAKCIECGADFNRPSAGSRADTCSRECWTTRYRRRQRGYGLMSRSSHQTEEQAHGRIAKYNRGCRCAACRSVAAAQRKDQRARSRERAA